MLQKHNGLVPGSGLKMTKTMLQASRVVKMVKIQLFGSFLKSCPRHENKKACRLRGTTPYFFSEKIYIVMKG